MRASAQPISVVVATRDRPRQLHDCLVSLRASVEAGDEVIVVDSCSSDGRTAEVAGAFGVRLVRCDRPGASLARNAGWRLARHGFVAFVDDDVRVAPTWADSLRRTVAAHPEASFVSGRLGLREEDAGAERPVAFFDEQSAFVIDEAVVDDWGHGANFAVRRDALADVGGFDERLGPGTPWPAAEDRELLDRLLAGGYRGRYEPSVRAVHVQWRGRPQLLRLEWRYGVGQGARLARLSAVDRGRYRAVCRIVWKQQGTVDLARCLRAGHEFDALSILVRLAGTAAGQLTARLGDGGARTAGPGRRPRAPGRRVRPSPTAAPGPRSGRG